LRINGRKIPHHRIIIDKQDVQSPFYGSVMIEKDIADIVMRNFQHGGFVDTGDYLELSYKIADDFLHYNNIGKTYLIISTDSIFNPDNAIIIPSTDVDVQRSKIIFNNIFWNKYGEDNAINAIFTFGYKTSELYGDTIHINPTCEEEMPQQNGSISFIRRSGLQGFNYSLQLQPLKEPQIGTFYGDTLTIDNLASGTYVLTISEIGGTNFVNNDSIYPLTNALSESYSVNTDSVWVDWNIRGINTNTTVGFVARSEPLTNFNPNSPNNNPTYGVKIENNQIKDINGNVIFTITDSIGSRIRLERNGNTISTILYNHFGERIDSLDINTIDNSSYYYISVSLNKGSSPIYNLKTNGFDDFINWSNSNDSMRIEYSTADQARYIFVLKSPCDGNDVNNDKEKVTPPSEDSVAVYYNNYNDLRQIIVSITLTEPSSGTLYIYDVTGKLISSRDIDDNVYYQEIPITLPVLGVYIIKVETTNNKKLEAIKVL
jgi:hypothetical protein